LLTFVPSDHVLHAINPSFTRVRVAGLVVRKVYASRLTRVERYQEEFLRLAIPASGRWVAVRSLDILRRIPREPGGGQTAPFGIQLDEEQTMKYPTIQRKAVAYGSALLFIGAICIAPPLALTQSPADGQTKGAAINSTPGTTTIPNPADQLGNVGGMKPDQQAAIDKMFVKKAMQGNIAEVQLGELTLQKSNNDQVKQFARKMIDDHTKLNEQMRSVALQLSVEIPTEVSKKDKSLMNKMQALSGTAYDQAYIKEMVKDHKQDLSEFRMEASNGHVKDAATQGSKVISEHLQMAQQLAKDQNVDLAKK
jgi:putative membrane protein